LTVVTICFSTLFLVISNEEYSLSGDSSIRNSFTGKSQPGAFLAMRFEQEGRRCPRQKTASRLRGRTDKDARQNAVLECAGPVFGKKPRHPRPFLRIESFSPPVETFRSKGASKSTDMQEAFVHRSYWHGTMEKLDSYDRLLLKVLQENGRASNVELSNKVDLSAPQCYRRIRRLEADSVIRGYSARIDPIAIGLGVTAFVSLHIERGQYEQIHALEKTIRQFPEILECYRISGDFDYLLKVVATDLKAFSSFLTERLMQVPGISNAHSAVCLEEIKPAGSLPIAMAPAANQSA
jgi:Lrp/AsnC family leucine-responsive transcriptional regulator